MIPRYHKYSYTYDDVGNRMTMVVADSSGAKTHVYQYDDIYQLTDVNYPTGYDYLATDTTFNYDAVGNRTTVVDGSGTTTYTANALNQYTAVADVNYTYDDNGNMTYDGANTYSYDPENRLITATKCSGPLAAACDIEELTFTTGGDGQWFAQTTESNYDGDAAQSGDIGDNEEIWLETTVEGTGTIRFDRKVSTDGSDSLSFRVDGQYKAGWTGGGWGEYFCQITTGGTHTLRWTYTKGSSGSGGSDCAWVDHVRWSGDLPDPNGWREIAYTYDPAGRRIEKAVEGQTQVKYLYDGDHCIAEYDANDTLLRKYIYGPGVDQPICMIEVADSNATYYYHYDALGSVAALSDEDGDTVQLYEYSVYGRVAASDPNHTNPFMFTGRRFDADTGLYYYRARYYNPYIGRFLQTDPIGYGDGMNLYRYCSNNPIMMVDPSGQQVLEQVFQGWAYIRGSWLRMTRNEGQPGWNVLGISNRNGCDPCNIITVEYDWGTFFYVPDDCPGGNPYKGEGILVGGGEFTDRPADACDLIADAVSGRGGSPAPPPDDPPPCCDLICALAGGGGFIPKWDPRPTRAQYEVMKKLTEMGMGKNPSRGWGRLCEALARLVHGQGNAPKPPEPTPPGPKGPGIGGVGGPIIVLPPNVRIILDTLCGECRSRGIKPNA